MRDDLSLFGAVHRKPMDVVETSHDQGDSLLGGLGDYW